MHKHRKFLKPLSVAAAVVLLLPVVVLWSWNTLAGAVVPVAQLNYAQALAIVLLLGSAGFLFGHPVRRHRPEHRELTP